MSQLGGPLPEIEEDEEKRELFSRPFDYLDKNHPWVGKATNATIKFLQNISDDPASEWNRERYSKFFKEDPQKIEQINKALDKGEHDPLGQIFGQGIEIARHIPTVAGFQPIDKRAAITALIATPIARRIKPKHLGINVGKWQPGPKSLPEPTVARSLINVTEGQSIFSMPTPKVKGFKPKGLLRKYQNPKGGEVYDPNVFISKAEMSAMLNTMTVDGAEGYGLFSVKPASDLGAIGDLNLIPKAGALYGKMNRQGKAGKESGERIASKFASPLEITQFNKKYGGISRRLLGAVYTSPFAPHHLVPHEDAARINIRGDAEQVWTEINNLSPRKHTPGNVRENLIGAMHRKNAAFIQSGKESIIQQKPEWVQTSKPYTWNDPYLGELTSTPDRILKDIIKDPGDAPYPSEIKSLSSIGLPESGVWPSGNKVTPKQKAVAWKERFDYWGIDRKQVKFDPKGDIIGVDHVEIGHAAIKLHPKYKEIQELLNNRDLYLSKSAKEAAAIIEPGLRVAENVFININKLRLDLIKEHLGFLTRTGIDKNGRPKFKSNPTIVKQYEGQVTERIVTWIADNPAKAASLGGSLLTKDLNKMLKWLEKDPGKLTDEFNKVFSAEIQNEASMTEPPSSQQLSDLKDKFNK